MIMKKSGFTLAECIISITITAFLLTGTFFVQRDVKKAQFQRDQKLISMTENISVIETAKSTINDLSDLYDFMQQHTDVKVIQAGVGEVTLEKKNNIVTVKKTGEGESALSQQIRTVRPNLFRITANDMQCVIVLKEGR